MSRRRARLHEDEQGVTLIELLVVVVLIGILGGIVLTTALAVQRITTTTEARLANIGEARIAANTLQRQLRTAVRATPSDVVLRDGQARSITFLSLVAGQSEPDLITFAIDASGEIVQTSQTADPGTGPNWTFTVDTPRTRPLLTTVDAAASLFQYFDLDSCAARDVEAPGCDPLPLDATTGLSAGDRNLVDMIEINLPAEGGAGLDTPVVLTSRVTLRNSAYVPEPEPTSTETP